MQHPNEKPNNILDRKLKNLKFYQNRAIDFSKRNRLLKYPTRASSVEFYVSMEDAQQFFGTIAELKIELPYKEILKQDQDEQTQDLSKDDELSEIVLPKTNIIGKKLITQLDKLRLQAKNNFDSHGLHTLFLAVGELKWKEELAGRGSTEAISDYDYSAPLILIPVSIKTQKAPQKMSVIEINDELYDIQINPVLKLFIQQELELRLPELPEDFSQFSWEDVEKLLHRFEKVLKEKKIDSATTTKIRLGQFTFHGQQIYEDLTRNEKKILDHEFISSLCGDGQIIQSEESVDASDQDEIDNFLTEEEDYTILDGDESQLRSIKAVLDGKHLVIHGPPGTGKSQTIANLIANLLARGKKVLFVCEKQVALKVVFDRLKTKGADVSDLCLPLFEHASDKKLFAKSIIDSRSRVVSALRNVSKNSINQKLADRKEIIDALKEYADALLMVVEPMNKTVYWMHGELARVSSNVEGFTIPWRKKSVDEVDWAAYQKIMRILTELSLFSDLLFDTDNQWKYIKQESFSPDYSARLFAKLSELKNAVTTFPQLDGTVFGNPKNISEVKKLLDFANSTSVADLLKNRLVVSEKIDADHLNEEMDFSEKIHAELDAYYSLIEAENIFKIPSTWNNVDYTFSLLDKNFDTSKLLSRKSEVIFIDGKVSSIEKMVGVNRLGKELGSLSGATLKKYKDIFHTDPIIQKLKNWDERVTLYEIQASLKQLKDLHDQILAAQEVLNEWAVIDAEIGPDVITKLENSFSAEYQPMVDGMTGDMLKILKGLCDMDFRTQKLKNWDSKIALLQAKNNLDHLKTLNDHLFHAQEMLHGWGIPSIEHLNAQMVFDMETRFIEKYGFFRAFQGTYKEDKNFIASQCSIRQPGNHADYKSIISLIANKLRIQLKIEQMWTAFLGEFSMDGSIKEVPIVSLMENISKLLSYLEFTGTDVLTGDMKSLLLPGSAEEFKQLVFAYEKLLTEKQIGIIPPNGGISFDGFSKFYPIYKNDTALVGSWCSSHRPQTYSEYKKIVFAVADKFRLKVKFNRMMESFVDGYATDDSVKNVSIVSLHEGVAKILQYLELSNIDRLNPEIKNLASATDLFDSFNQIIASYEELFEKRQILNDAVNQDQLTENTILIDFISTSKAVVSELKNSMVVYEDAVKFLTVPSPILEKLALDTVVLNQLKNVFDRVNQYQPQKYVGASGFADLLNSRDQISQQRDQIKAVLAIIENRAFSKNDFYKNLETLCQEIVVWNEWYSKYDQIKDGIELLMNNKAALNDFQNVAMSDFSDRINKMLTDVGGLEKWTKLQRVRSQLDEYGMDWFLSDIKKLGIAQANFADIFVWSFLNGLLAKLYNEHKVLKNFNIAEYSRYTEDFKRLEKEVFETNQYRVLSKVYPTLRYAMDRGGNSEKVIVRESQKIQRHVPIRKLVTENAGHLLDCKPCWMMSPLTLSSYIPFGSIDFDVVIFDEASQMKIENALGAIARAKQVIVIGDEHQLPPTSFFDVSSEDDEAEDMEDVGYESILQSAITILPGAQPELLYHYRSTSEDLIAFSNRHIYGGRLITFPSPKYKDDAIQFEYVENGVYDAGQTRRNRIEAIRVAELCAEYVQSDARSIGVIAFSKAQEEAIREAIEEKIKDMPQLADRLEEGSDKKEGFFIKNLESVQGDERDVIILSIGYGPDQNGNVYNRFGPLNSKGGYRRLNVAITRAKDKVICVSSMKFYQMNPPETSRGAVLLQKYLEYAENGRSVLDASKILNHENGEADSDFEISVQNALENLGYTIHRQVGASGFSIDLAVVNPKNNNEYLLGIECDGAAYHSSKSARIRDRLRQEVLERLGWRFYRIWSQHWITHRQEVLDDLVSMISKSQ